MKYSWRILPKRILAEGGCYDVKCYSLVFPVFLFHVYGPGGYKIDIH